MADSKISDLTDGGAPQAADVLVAVRSGSNVKTAIPTGGYARLGAAQTFGGGQRPTVTAVESASGSTAFDFALGNDFSTILSEDTIFALPSNRVEGQTGCIDITNGASAYTVGYASGWVFVGDVTPEVTASAGARDCLFYRVLRGGDVLGEMRKGIA